MRRKSVVPWAAFCVLTLALPAQGGAQERNGEGTAESPAVLLLDEIQALESSRDAKCKATADRLEDFISGTPLSESARFEKTRLQKEWVASRWEQAAGAARQAGDPEIQVVHLAPVLAGWESPAIEERDLSHYSSVAYSLRAILAVQQESLLGARPGLLPADTASFNLLRRQLDQVSVVALRHADRLARQAGDLEIEANTLAQAWKAALAGASLDAAHELVKTGPAATGVFRGIIKQKLASYTAYNDLSEDAERLFDANLRHYFARYPLPDEGPGLEELRRRIRMHLGGFAAAFLEQAVEEAARQGHPLIRMPDVEKVLQRLTPHQVNVFEDAEFFPRLERSERKMLEAYDMDSFRDLGMHWELIEAALQNGVSLAIEPDPFAAEALAEGIAQYGVLALRVAGDLAREEEAHELTPEHLQRAGEWIRRHAERDRSAPEAPPVARGLTSSLYATPAGGGPFFTDVTAAVGLRFEHRTSDWLSRFRRSQTIAAPTFSGGGIAAEDIDGDGFTDLLLLGGVGNVLLHNEAGAGFRDVTAASGLLFLGQDGRPPEPRQPLIVDLDNDGLQDIVITLVNENHRVFRNLGSMRFADVTDQAGLGGKGLIGGPATALDFDSDGRLDLYIGYFGNYIEGELPKLARDNRNGQPNQLFRNRGGIRFELVEDPILADTGWTQAVSHTDIDGDGKQDLVIANDYGRNAVLRNLGEGRFEDLAAELGMDDSAHSMNVGVADLNADEHPDIYISNIVSLVKDDRYVLPSENEAQHFKPEAMARMRVVESNKLFVSERQAGKLTYVVSNAITRGAHSTGWAWDADFFDFDNDGDDDLYCVNGANDYFIFGETRYLARGDSLMSFPYTYGKESNVFFVNEGSQLRDESEKSGADFVGTSRSSAYLDFDRDGDLDIAVNNFHLPAVFLRNNSQEQGHHWLRLKLVGDPASGSNRDAIGARLVARTASGTQIWREIRGGTGYLSMDPKEVHFGLGADERVEIWVRWPGGREQMLRGLQADRSYVVVEGEEAVLAALP